MGDLVSWRWPDTKDVFADSSTLKMLPEIVSLYNGLLVALRSKMA